MLYLRNFLKRLNIIGPAILIMLCLSSFQAAGAAQMNDYCVTPPYVGGSLLPNLLLMIDNSASMADLVYTDTSHLYCANSPNTACNSGTTCSGTAYCLASATTTTISSTTPAACTPGAAGDLYCTTEYGSTDECMSQGAHKNQCKRATITTNQVTYTPISCTQDSTCNAITTGDICNNKCTVSHTCFDNTYDNTKVCSSTRTTICTTDSNCPSGETCVGRYDGYFNQTTSYCYSTFQGLTTCSSSRGAYDEFDGGAAIPSSCTYGGASSTSPFVCINTASGRHRLNQFVATGNFLNWLTMSKFDIEKKIPDRRQSISTALTRTARRRAPFPRNRADVQEENSSRPCRACLDLTFGVRGGSLNWMPSITSQATEYGQTFIEIYGGRYNAAACTAAVNDWMTVTTTNLGTLQNDTKCCLAGGTSTNGCNPSSETLVAANQVIHDCFWYYNGHGLSNLQPLENACTADYSLISSVSITNPDAGDAVCSSVLSHPASLVDGNTLGFLGLCYNGVTGQWNDACALTENKDFCQAIGGAGGVTDPQSGTVAPTAVQNIPGFITESGVSGMPMLNDYSSAGGVKGFKVAVYDSTQAVWPPTGLIDKYKNSIRFGAMAFQNNGSATECNQNGYCSNSAGTSCTADAACPSGGKCIFAIPCPKVCSAMSTRVCYNDADCPSGDTCGSLTKTDGAFFPGMCSLSTDKQCSADANCPSGETCKTLWSYVGNGKCSATQSQECAVDSDCPPSETCDASVGSHTTGGLISVVDNIQASSWTPFAEAFYNAMGYYARLNDPNYTASPPPSRNFNFSGLPAGYVTNKNPSQMRCQKNNIMIITDGMSTADRNSASESLASLYSSYTSSYPNASGYDTSNSCPSYGGSRSLSTLAWVGNHLNIKTLSTSATTTAAPTNSSEYINTYVVYSGSMITTSPAGLCNPYNLMSATAYNGGGSFYPVSDLSLLNKELDAAFGQIAAAAASGTAASVLASGEGSGANLIQAVFYPRRSFWNSSIGSGGAFEKISWTGRLSNLWYYVDPFFSTTNMREDDGDKILHLQTGDGTHKDYITSLFYDKTTGITKAHRWEDPAGNGVIGTELSPDIDFENLSTLWEAGTLLWKRNVFNNTQSDFSKRKIYTSVTGTSYLSGNFSADTRNGDSDNTSTLQPYLQAATAAEARNLINWVHGIDGGVYRRRTVKIESVDTTARVWKLGDIVNSTPKIASWTALNTYHKTYNDSTYGMPGQDAKLEDPVDSTHYLTTSTYKQRGTVFTGGNDGMLHAFKLGQLQLKWTGQGSFDVARLVNPITGQVCSSSTASTSGVPTCGQEVWAFIPKNALPYLRYMADPGYCHLYSIDLTPIVFDASIGAPGSADVSNTQRVVSHWRTVLIGGMRFGGACRKTGSVCNDSGTDCVNTPLTDPADSSKGLGYSSYFALDVTDADNPQLLWEFADETLGFATSGAAVVRINGSISGASTKEASGNWFVVIGSGPTGPIDSGSHQFMGRSDQNLRLFILDLKTGALIRTIDTGIANAYSGTLANGSLDVDQVSQDYQDEIVYVPFTKKNTSLGTWTDGGVLRLLTKKDPSPGNWSWNTFFSGAAGPITTAVGKLVDNDNHILWTYFGTGRYYYVEQMGIDDANGQRYLLAVKDPCFDGGGYHNTCTDSRTLSDLTNVTDVANVPTTSSANSSSVKGWYISLDLSGIYTYSPDSAVNFMAERVITDPLASTRGIVYFTSYKPYTDQCNLGGKSFIWALQYNTGGPPANLLQGNILIQVSTGAIEQRSLASAFTDAGGRKSAAMEGKPPEAQGMSVLGSPSPSKRVIHVRER